MLYSAPTDDDGDEHAAAMTQESRSTDAHLDALDEKLDRVLSGLKEIESLKSIINNLREEVKDLKTSLNFAQENIAQLQKEVAKTTTTVDEHSDNLDSMDADIEALKRRNIKLEAYTRRENMRIYKIREEPEEKTEEVVRNLLTNQMQIPSQVVKSHSF